MSIIKRMDQPTQPTTPATPPITPPAPVAPTPAAQPTQPIQPAQPASRPSELISPDKIYQPAGGGNLIRSPITVESGHAWSRWKIAIIDELLVLSAALFGYCFSKYLLAGV